MRDSAVGWSPCRACETRRPRVAPVAVQPGRRSRKRLCAGAPIDLLSLRDPGCTATGATRVARLWSGSSIRPDLRIPGGQVLFHLVEGDDPDAGLEGLGGDVLEAALGGEAAGDELAVLEEPHGPPGGEPEAGLAGQGATQ